MRTCGTTEKWIHEYERMTQYERWLTKNKEVVDFIQTNHRNPSRHRLEEHDMLNWLKANSKAMNAGGGNLSYVYIFDNCNLKNIGLSFAPRFNIRLSQRKAVILQAKFSKYK